MPYLHELSNTQEIRKATHLAHWSVCSSVSQARWSVFLGAVGPVPKDPNESLFFLPWATMLLLLLALLPACK